MTQLERIGISVLDVLGHGAGERVGVTEMDCWQDHPDNAQLIDYHHDDWRFRATEGAASLKLALMSHGTMSVGTIGADANDYGATGIAHEAWLEFVPMSMVTFDRVAEYIVSILPPGSVVSMSFGVATGGGLPLAIDNGYFREGLTILANEGMIPVMGAGNASLDVDQYWPDHEDQAGPGIIVGASFFREDLGAHVPATSTNYGEAVQVFAPGKAYTTTVDWDYQPGYGWFAQTSGATAVVSGILTDVQGILRKSGRDPMTWLELEDAILRTGTEMSYELLPVKETEGARVIDINALLKDVTGWARYDSDGDGRIGFNDLVAFAGSYSGVFEDLRRFAGLYRKSWPFVEALG